MSEPNGQEEPIQRLDRSQEYLQGDPQATLERRSSLYHVEESALDSDFEFISSKVKLFAQFMWAIIKPIAQSVWEKAKPMAFLASAVHFPPIIATTVISKFIYEEHWVGSTLSEEGRMETQTSLAIQFAAKFLELFIVASLATMMFTFVQREITLKKGLPLAAILAATDFKSPSFVWSDEFFAMVMAPFSSIWKKAFLLSFTLICAFLATIVAPATATILLPREDWYTMGGTTVYINATNEVLFPAVITSNHTLNGSICDTRFTGVSRMPAGEIRAFGQSKTYRFKANYGPTILNTRVFQQLSETARLSEEIDARLNWTFGPVETIINGMLGNGMARTAPYASPIWDLQDPEGDDWWQNFFAHREGLFLLWSLTSGITSSSWDSTPELVALAMRSHPPENGKMETSVFEDTAALKQTYRVVADQEDNVRLVARSEIADDETGVELNKKYR
ncbi:hypothetical protein CMUS01_14055 [Colletotrichum musicola]|uniref:Uncharacterized protein n=1 Tax=Colletotrichum musicola TaxID=2175873 RepID=A0A8H6MTK1_9PEZI|nr:hypothetical protein CMUS01_14055 [Colletotrichum musicola]